MTRDEFRAAAGFELDDFQVRALDAIDGGRSVLVAAPTGSGKTVVADYALAKALDEGGKAFYTTPLKALSNQKYGDFVRRHGAAKVGLLTGDNAINGDAPIVVMTTEVLRNMIYAAAPALAGLRYVVLDEVHYLQNPYRGAVWEEVIIHLPLEVDLVCLSATVSNAEEFAEWIATVRGATEAIIEERRPVQLTNLYLIGDRSSEHLHLLPTFVDGQPNPEAASLDSRAARTGAARQGPLRRGRLYTPRRGEVIDRLGEEDMLPAIYFIFSRAACDDAVRQCLAWGLRLTNSDERRQIRAIAEAKVDALSDADLRILGYDSWVAGLENGFASHHAGLVPPFKEAVEACFAAALVKVVFATETLSLGINMPARSVVLEKLTKFTGERHEPLTPGEYTQFTGRAGRRGIDDRGYAVVLWSPFVPFDTVASLASKRTYALTSSFRPTYNMAVNLVRRYQPDTAHHLLNLSFGQYRSDSEVVRLERDLETAQRRLAKARAAAACELGDVEEYRRLARAADEAARLRPSDRVEVADALHRIRPGDILVIPGRKGGGRVAVVSTSPRRGGDIRVKAVNGEGDKLALGPRDFPVPPRPVGRVELPEPFAPNHTGFLRQVAARLRDAPIRQDGLVGVDTARRGSRLDEALRHTEALEALPVTACPDLAEHLRALRSADRAEREARDLERQVRSRNESLARQFDRVLRILEAWGFVDGWALTAEGEMLSRIYHESDLLVAECLRAGVLDGLEPPELAALASTFVYENRGPGPGPAPWFSSAAARDRWSTIETLGRELNLAEQEAGLPLTRPPDAGFAAMASRWAAGTELAQVLGEDEMTGGDFVRITKTLIDLLRQLAIVAPEPATRQAADVAAESLYRGVVAASSVIGADSASPAPPGAGTPTP